MNSTEASPRAIFRPESMPAAILNAGAFTVNRGRSAPGSQATSPVSLARTGGNMAQAAKILGLTYRSIRYKVKKLGVAAR